MPIILESLDGSPLPAHVKAAMEALFGEHVTMNGAEHPEADKDAEPELTPADPKETVTLNVEAVEAFANSVLALQSSMDHMQEFASALCTAADNEKILQAIHNKGCPDCAQGAEQASPDVAMYAAEAAAADTISDAVEAAARGYALAVYRMPWADLGQETREAVYAAVKRGIFD